METRSMRKRRVDAELHAVPEPRRKEVRCEIGRKVDPEQSQSDTEPEPSVVCGDLSPACQTLGEVHFEQLQFRGTHVKTISVVGMPYNIAFATTGEIVVCEQNPSCVSVFDSRYRHLRSFGNTGPEESKLMYPLGVAISSDNMVFVSDCHCVKKFTLEGQFIASVGTKGSGRLQFNALWGIAYNGTNNKVYVCDTWNHRITILNHDLTFHENFGSGGSDPGQFRGPTGISVNIKGNVAVADNNNNRIQVFDASGHFLSAITHTVSGQRLQGPVSVSVGPDDCMYVLEQSSYRVSIFDHTGKYVKSFGKKGNKDGEFGSVYCVAVSDEGYVYVSDAGNNRIQVFK